MFNPIKATSVFTKVIETLSNKMQPEQNQGLIFNNFINKNKAYEADFKNLTSINDILSNEDVACSTQNAQNSLNERFVKIHNATQETLPVNFTYKDDPTQEANGLYGGSKQGKAGDCWALSSINALNSTPIGKKILLNSFANDKENSQYLINFKGANATYNVTYEELEKAQRSGIFSTGDKDVAIMELAVEKLLYDVRDGKLKLPQGAPNIIDKNDKTYKESPLQGGWPSDLLYLLTGEKAARIYNPTNTEAFVNSLNKCLDDLEKFPQSWATIVFNPNGNKDFGPLKMDKRGYPVIEDITGKQHLATDDRSPHAWTIKGCQGNRVILTNPWDSQKEIIVERDALYQYGRVVEYYHFTGTSAKSEEVAYL